MAQRTCDVDGCDRKHQARGMCASHWSRWYRETHPDRDRGSREAEMVTRTCVQCGSDWRTRRKNAKLCSDQCRSAWYVAQRIGKQPTICRLPSDHPVREAMRQNAAKWQERSALRTAIESGDHGGVVAAVREFIELDGDCWIWQRRLSDGYPVVKVGKRTLQVHRLVLEAKYGAKLGKQAAHHKCARSACVNPDHLQPVTARENTAEMLARTYMVQRIAALETALAAVNPTHPLLAEIGVAAS